MGEPCPGCGADAGEPCRPSCLSWVTDDAGQPVERWTIGEPSPIDLLDLPGLSWSVSAGARLVLVVPSDDPALTDAAAGADVWLGLAQAGPVPVVLARFRDDAGQVLGYWEAPGPWLLGNDAPEVTYTGPEHIAWTLHIVEGAPGYERAALGDARPMRVTGLRAFTTSPAFTRALRRAHAEQRAAGPMTDAEAMAHMGAYYERHPAGVAAWRRAIVTSRAGE